MTTQAVDRKRIHATVGLSARIRRSALPSFTDGPSGLLILPLKGDTLAPSSVPPEWRYPSMTGFRVRIVSLMGTLMAIAAVVGNSKSF
jgi:hypothetical protein